MVYTELHCHSAYSFLDGASLPEELAVAAKEHGYGALALTDHNSVGGSMEFAQAAAGLGIKAIHGAEVDVLVGSDSSVCLSRTDVVTGVGENGICHLTVLVENQRGWSNLC